MAKEYKTDGELYNESLTRKTQNEAADLYAQIIKQIDLVGFITVYDVVVYISKFQKPKNWEYAATHGWTRKSIERFYVQKTGDGRYGVYLGSPHKLLNDE